MKPKKNDRVNVNDLFVFPLCLFERHAVWSSLDLLRFSTLKVNLQFVDQLCAFFQKHDGEDVVVDLEIKPHLVLICFRALTVAVQYLDGIRKNFPDSSPELDFVAGELSSLSPIVRNLQNRFRKAADVIKGG